MRYWLRALALAAILSVPAASRVGALPAGPIEPTIEGIVARMRSALTMEQMLAADAATVERFVTTEDRERLATRFWSFDVNVPARVSVMRHTGQATVPFWLSERGFRRTELRVRNEEYEYEVWQKDFPAGRVGLGINGFDQHRVHYFACVGALRPGQPLTVRNARPATELSAVMGKGATIYHDWPDLVLTEVPAELEGHILLPTIRGRAREAHLIGGFRSTPHPSSATPDQIGLTWAGGPTTSMAIQWRTSPEVRRGLVEWRKQGDPAWRRATAAAQTLRDTRILNDPVVRRFTANLQGLAPGTAYEYRVGASSGPWSGISVFRTAPSANAPAPFSFVWLSDTHNRPDTASLLERASTAYPDAAFCAITGDLVGTGQRRDDWDQLFAHTAAWAASRPIAPAIGNHDTIDGLGADLYLRHFALPANGARGLERERSYSFEYGNALFIVLDSTDSIEAQTPWLERVLQRSRATWKFALFHFPPYALSEDYPEIQREWCPLFDRYGVDVVLCGHVHHLQRTLPMRGGKIAVPPDKGVIYAITVAVGQSGRTFPEAPTYAAVAMEPGPPLFHAFRIDGGRLVMRCHDATGKVWDELVVTK